MMLKKITLIAAAASMAIAPAMAQPSASKLSLAGQARASTGSKNASGIHGSTAIVAILALAAIIGGIIIATKKQDKPKSP